MSCNLDMIISSVVLNYLNNKVDKSIAISFQKKTNALSLAKGSPKIEDIFNHFVQTNSKSRKIKFNAIGDAEQSSSEEDVPQITTNTAPVKPVKVETAPSEDSVSEQEEITSKKSENDFICLEKQVSTKEKPQQIQKQTEDDNNIEAEYYIDRNPQQVNNVVNEQPESTMFAENNVGSSFDNYFKPTYPAYLNMPEDRRHYRGPRDHSRIRKHYNNNRNFNGRKTDNSNKSKYNFKRGSKPNKKTRFD